MTNFAPFDYYWMKNWLTKLGGFIKGCLIMELLLPVSPLVIQFLMKWAWPSMRSGSDPTMYKIELASSAMMLPLVLVIRTDRGASRGFYTLFLIAGLLFYVMCVVIESQVWPQDKQVKDLQTAYNFAAFGLVLSSLFRGISELAKTFSGLPRSVQ